MPYEVIHLAMATLDDRPYIFGGFSPPYTVLKHVYMLPSFSFQWKERHDLPLPLYGHAVVATAAQTVWRRWST